MRKAPGHLKKMLLAPVFSMDLLLSKEKRVNSKLLKMLKEMWEQGRKDCCHMNCQSPQVARRKAYWIHRNPDSSHKMIVRSLFMIRCRWGLENCSESNMPWLYPWRWAEWEGIIWEYKWQRRKVKLSKICSGKESWPILKDSCYKSLYQCIDIDFYPKQIHRKNSVTLFWESVKGFFPLLRHTWDTTSQ